MQVRNLMTTDTACCSPDASLREAAQLMADCDCGAIPVTDDGNGRLLGMITDRDIACRAVAQGLDPNATRVDEIMTSPALTVSPDASLEEALNRMEQAQVRRIPVTDGQGRCKGILSQADIATHTTARDTAELVSAVSQPGGNTLGMSGGMSM